jgi:succinate-acetate transporter protein
MILLRPDGRRPDELRPVKICHDFLKYAEGSVLIEVGDTKLICSASIEDKIPPFLKGTGKGWVTAFSTYGAFWLSLATLSVFESTGVIDWGGYAGTALGIFLLGFTIFNTYMWIASFRTNGAVCGVFTTLEITFILLVLAEFGIISSVPGGIMGIVTAAVAWYASAAGVINSTYKRTVLPIFPLDK